MKSPYLSDLCDQEQINNSYEDLGSFELDNKMNWKPFIKITNDTIIKRNKSLYSTKNSRNNFAPHMLTTIDHAVHNPLLNRINRERSVETPHIKDEGLTKLIYKRVEVGEKSNNEYSNNIIPPP